MFLGLFVSRVSEVVFAFCFGEAAEQFADTLTNGIGSTGSSLSQEMLEFCENLFDGVQVRGLFGQEE